MARRPFNPGDLVRVSFAPATASGEPVAPEVAGQVGRIESWLGDTDDALVVFDPSVFGQYIGRQHLTLHAGVREGTRVRLTQPVLTPRDGLLVAGSVFVVAAVHHETDGGERYTLARDGEHVASVPAAWVERAPWPSDPAPARDRREIRDEPEDRLTTSERSRLAAWAAVVDHPFLAPALDGPGALIDEVLARLDTAQRLDAEKAKWQAEGAVSALRQAAQGLNDRADRIEKGTDGDH